MTKEITFADLGLSPEILEAIERKGYKTPSAIQAGVIPLLLNWDKDIIWQAQTGTGKTASFWLPLLERIDENKAYTQAVIMAPTRELAIQVAEEIKSFNVKKGLNIALLYGGQSYNTEMAALRKKPQIVVGTPWRLKDHLNKKRLDLSKIDYFILDEADEMLNVGFKEEIDEILTQTPKDKKVLLFSATMPKVILEMVKKYMREYDLVSVKKDTLTNSSIIQKYYGVNNHQKFDALTRIIDTEEDFYAIVFCQRKVDVDEVNANLVSNWYKSEAIHWDVEQKARERILKRFKDKKIKILVATDVAARWIDIADLTHVVNYSLPDNPETYTHRIGRTGRAWKDWIAISFVTSSERRKLSYIETIIKKKIDKHAIPKVEEIIEGKKKRAIQRTKANIEEGKLADFHDMSLELLKLGSPEDVVAAVLKKLYKDEFNHQNYREIRESNSREVSDKIRLFVAKWREDDMGPVDIKVFIEEKTGVNMRVAGRIDIFDKFSYVEVPFAEWEVIMKAFKQENPARPVVVKAKERRSSGGSRSGGGWYRGNRGWSSFGNRSWGWRSGGGWYRGNRSWGSRSGSGGWSRGGFSGNRRDRNS